MNRHEELPPSRLPVLAIGRDPAAGDQQMHMGVIGQLAVPGVEHREDAGHRPEQPFLGTELRDGAGRDSHQQAIEQLLVASERRAQLLGHGHDGMEIVAGQELGLTLLEPLLGLARMAFGARPVPTAVVVPEGLIAVVAAVQPSSQLGRAAGGDVRKRLLLRGHHPVAVLRRVLRAEPAYDVSQFDVGLGRANAVLSHDWASSPRRGPRWSGPAGRGADPATAG